MLIDPTLTLSCNNARGFTTMVLGGTSRRHPSTAFCWLMQSIRIPSVAPSHDSTASHPILLQIRLELCIEVLIYMELQMPQNKVVTCSQQHRLYSHKSDRLCQISDTISWPQSKTASTWTGARTDEAQVSKCLLGVHSVAGHVIYLLLASAARPCLHMCHSILRHHLHLRSTS